MPITPYLNGRTFDPEIVMLMGAAFERACATLKIRKENPMLRAQVAETVIALANRGLKDVEELAAATVKQMRRK